MQIFALFMLCGTAVSFLLPETRGRTLEELAGEPQSTSTQSSPSSNGSLTLTPSTFIKRHNPFAGGKPAGFNYVKSPNLGPRSSGLRGKRERMGIMTSPELVPKQPSKKGHGKAASEGSVVGYTVSVSSRNRTVAERRADENDDLYLAGAGGALPGWGSGWSVDRGLNSDSTVRRGDGVGETILLNDVGRFPR